MSRFTTVFLDRDGTLNIGAPVEGDYVWKPSEVQLLPGVGSSLAALGDARLIVITNQRGVSLGVMTMQDVEATNAELASQLAAFDVEIAAFYVCPHEAGACDCRKPLPGLIARAVSDFPEIDLAHSVMIGDNETDVGCGRAAGIATVRLAPAGTSTDADHLADDLASALPWL